MENCKIAFIGGGNMAHSFIGGLIACHFKPQNIHVSDPETACLQSLTDSYPKIQTFVDNNDAVKDCVVVILAVKPQKLRKVALQLATDWQTETLLISIAAGIHLQAISDWMGHDVAIVRVMPNTPLLVQAGASALCANNIVSIKQRKLAESILESVGIALWIDEEEMDVVTALSGGGPAYFLLVMEAMEYAAEKIGLKADKARLLCLQTAFGTAKMALESNDPPNILRKRVTSPNGVTERAVNELEKGDLHHLFKQALTAAASRSRELGKQTTHNA